MVASPEIVGGIRDNGGPSAGRIGANHVLLGLKT